MSCFSQLFKPDPSDLADRRAQVNDLIKNNAVVVFAKSYCPYCAATKALLKKNGARFYSIDLDRASTYLQEENYFFLEDKLTQHRGRKRYQGRFAADDGPDFSAKYLHRRATHWWEQWPASKETWTASNVEQCWGSMMNPYANDSIAASHRDTYLYALSHRFCENDGKEHVGLGEMTWGLAFEY
jgi:hypothetical protein